MKYLRIQLSLIALFMFVTPVFAGMTYAVITVTDTEDVHAVMRARVQIEGSNARIDILEGGVAPLRMGLYLLTRDGGKTFQVVDPATKTYGLLDSKAIAGLTAAQLSSQMKVAITAPKVERLVDEAGQPMFQYPVRHQHFRTTYSVTVRLLNSYTSHIVVEEEVWSTDAIKDSGMKALPLDQLVPADNPELVALMEAEKSKAAGFPLKRDVTTTAEEVDGHRSKTRTQMSVTELKSTSIPKAVFEIPTTYKQVTLRSADED